MPEVKLELGARLHTLSHGELKETLAARDDAMMHRQAEGIKYRRLPLIRGLAAAGALSMGGPDASQDCGPNEGFAWMITRLSINGLAGGVTPDVVDLYRGGAGNFPVWQFTGNSFAATFTKLSLVYLPSETLLLASVGAFAATGPITVSGELLQVPAESLWKLI
jgi:hypothetical protein